MEIVFDPYVYNELKNSPSSPSLSYYSLQDYVSPYIGTTKNDGIWLIKKWESGSMRYANISNNPTKTIYSDAWTDRADLVYELIEELTGI